MKKFWMLIAFIAAFVCACTDAKQTGSEGGSAGAQACPGNCPSNKVCTPGEKGSPVTCGDGTQGFRICNTQGTAYDSVTCGTAPATGCGSTSQVCNSATDCTCNDGRTGTKYCSSDCSGYGSCVCNGPLPGSGGSSGSSGSGGSSATGGSAGSGGTTGCGGTSTGGSAGTAGSDAGTTYCGTVNAACQSGQQYDCYCQINDTTVTGKAACNANCTALETCQCSTSDAGTGGTGGSSADAGNCVPGDQIDCTDCSNGGKGYKVCSVEHQYGSCQSCTVPSGTGGSGGSPAQNCTPLSKKSCSCGGGISGWQYCTSDGLSYGACVECNSGTGGSGGSTQQNCVPLSKKSCSCGGGVSGWQYCTSDGLSYLQCVECGSSGTGGSGGSGGSSGQIVQVTCEVTHSDYTQNVQGTTTQHNYVAYASDLGLNGVYAYEPHVTWGNNTGITVTQYGRYAKVSFPTTLHNPIDMNFARDPVGSDPSVNGYWKEPGAKDGKVVMKVDCVVDVNGVVSQTAWPYAIQNNQHTDWNLRLVAEPAAITSTDSDGDGVADANDCAPNDYHRAPGLVEVEQDGIDNDCDGKDIKYIRIKMYGTAGLSTPMFATDWSKSLPMTWMYDETEATSFWATDYAPIEWLPTSGVNPGMFLVEYIGTCDNGKCWDCGLVGQSTCQEKYAVKAQTTAGSDVPVTLQYTAAGCRRFYNPLNQ